MWGAQEKSGGHIKNFSAGGHCAPTANCFRRHWSQQQMHVHQLGFRSVDNKLWKVEIFEYSYSVSVE